MAGVKHTPGPWRADGPDWAGDFNILHPADSLAIGAVVANLRPPEEVEANAMMAAAAPEMFDALKVAEEYLNTIALSKGPIEELSTIRAALAKAQP